MGRLIFCYFYRLDLYYITIMKRLLSLLGITIFSILILCCSSGKRVLLTESQDKLLIVKAHDYYLKGLFLQQEERYNEALVQYYQALLYDSTSSSIYNSVAENHMKLGHFDTALYYLNKSTKIKPDDEETLQLTAECFINLNQDDKAIAILKELLEINPFNEEARNFILYLYQKNNNDIGKAEQYEELISLYGRDPAMLETMAKIYLKHDNFERALHFYSEVLKVDSTNVRILYLMGIINEQNLKYDKAIKNFQEVLKYDPDNTDAIEHLAMLYRRKQKWNDIIIIYQPIFNKDSTDIGARVVMAEAYYYLKKLGRAKQLLLPAMENKNSPWGAYDLMGRIELESKNYLQALTNFNKIIEKDSTNRFGWLFLGFTYTDMGEISQAEKNYKQAVIKLPKDASLWSYYGLTMYSQKKYKEAVHPLKKALELEPLSMNALTTLPIIYENLKMYNQCDSLYEIAIKRFPDNDLLLNNYSYSLSERNIRVDEALEMAKKAVKGQPQNAAFLDTIGWIYFKLGQYEDAELYIKKSIEIQSNSPVVLEHLGDVYLKLKNIKQALNYWIDALNITPENNSLIEKVEKYR